MNNLLGPRPSPIAGQWYSSDARRLAAQIDRYMNDARPLEPSGSIVAVMVPHAGHIYSGPVAGYAFAALRGLSPEVVAVISPMHYPYFEPLLTTAHSAYTTPLGSIPVDHEALCALDGLLLSELGFGLERVAHDSEHSLEIELPFLQRALEKPFRLLPVMVRDQSVKVARGLARHSPGCFPRTDTWRARRDCWSPVLTFRIFIRSPWQRLLIWKCYARWKPWIRRA